MTCYLCKDSGYILSETGEKTVCLECQHEVITDPQPITKMVADRGHRERLNRLLRRVARPTDCVPGPRHTSDLQSEPVDWSDISNYRPNSVVPAPESFQLDSCTPHCPFCGTAPLVEEQMHGHYVCMKCHSITEGCCDGQGHE